MVSLLERQKSNESTVNTGIGWNGPSWRGHAPNWPTSLRARPLLQIGYASFSARIMKKAERYALMPGRIMR